MDYIWNITGKCNLQCQYCWDIFKNTAEVDTDQAKSVIDHITEDPCNMLLFTGGEPLIRDDLFDLIHYSKRHGVKYIKICTNGLLISKRIEEIKAAPISEIHISLDSIEDDSNDYRKKNFQVLQNIKVLLQNVDLQKTKIVLVSVIDFHRLYKFESVLKFAKENGIYVTYQLPASIDNHKLSLNIEHIQVEQLNSLFLSLHEYHRQYSKQIDYFANFYLLIAEKYYLEGKIPEQCQAGIGFQIISPIGEYYSCYTCKKRTVSLKECFNSKCLVWFRSNGRSQKLLKMLKTP